MGDHLLCWVFVPGWAEGAGSTFSAPCRVPPCRSLPPRSGPGLSWLPVCCCCRAFVTSMGSVWVGFASLGMLGPPPNELETQSLLGVFRHGYSAKALRTAFRWRCPAMLPSERSWSHAENKCPGGTGGQRKG